MLVVPGAAGDIGVLARHAPLVAMLRAGSTRVYLRRDGQVREFATGAGFFKVEQDRALALVDDALVRLQEEAGLDLLSDGMLTWQDLFRPLVEASAGLTARPLERFLDTNTFYRAVLVDAEPKLQRALPAPELPSGRWLATLPSPYSFSRAAQREVSAEALAANVLAPQIEAYAEAGCALVVLAEPFLTREASGLPALLAALAELPRPVPLALQLPFGDAGPLLPELAEAELGGIGVDFYATSADAVPEGLETTLLAGVVDARTSGLEDATELATFAERLRDRVAGEGVPVPNGDLQF